jgi:hypothetical protein
MQRLISTLEMGGLIRKIAILHLDQKLDEEVSDQTFQRLSKRIVSRSRDFELQSLLQRLNHSDEAVQQLGLNQLLSTLRKSPVVGLKRNRAHESLLRDKTGESIQLIYAKAQAVAPAFQRAKKKALPIDKSLIQNTWHLILAQTSQRAK